MAFADIYLSFVTKQVILSLLRSYVQNDGKRRWVLWEVVRIRWDHKGSVVEY